MWQFIIPAAAQAIASIWGANKSSKAATSATQMQVDAANRAAVLEAQSARDQLAFIREQDARERAQAELDRKMGYDQWAFRQSNLSPYRGIGGAATGTLGHLMGFSPNSMLTTDPRTEVPYTPYNTQPWAESQGVGGVMDPDREWEFGYAPEDDEDYS